MSHGEDRGTSDSQNFQSNQMDIGYKAPYDPHGIPYSTRAAEFQDDPQKTPPHLFTSGMEDPDMNPAFQIVQDPGPVHGSIDLDSSADLMMQRSHR
eukprot:CAMPEP_0175040862 /NCGR_PEP_ID=MMETSP0052_2-20121109/1534_1 /TAXON_ID=51329 ORGANISM="Polytomella parva, Strain SAG 63-3" /NCGR_SAMPLE_ID=MMETSP0052_2 /ASSEMBLY_ACC=CAM_ASM_000194 /LENGTH=95 /DNA_ID=CAMNT_0016303191 /DNA_START=142 /DNA_END=429 /DNA_ORIENTATION=+